MTHRVVVSLALYHNQPPNRKQAKADTDALRLAAIEHTSADDCEIRTRSLPEYELPEQHQSDEETTVFDAQMRLNLRASTLGMTPAEVMSALANLGIDPARCLHAGSMLVYHP